jgi:hypothetical protein
MFCWRWYSALASMGLPASDLSPGLQRLSALAVRHFFLNAPERFLKALVEA